MGIHAAKRLAAARCLRTGGGTAMAVKFTSVKCPECGANLPIEEGRTQVYCSYCGTKVIMTNENEYIIRQVDEAGILKAKTDQAVQLKKIELAEKRHTSFVMTKLFKIVISVVLGFLGMVFLLGGLLESGDPGLAIVGMICCAIIVFMWSNDWGGDDDSAEPGDRVRVPSDISNYETMSFAAVEALFVSAGFTNVKSVPLGDLRMGLLKKPGTVESITIRGREIGTIRRRFSPDAPVVIAYHSFC